MIYTGLINFGGGIGGRILQGDGERILWIHGYTLSSKSWLPIWSRLQGFYNLGVDLPGHGASVPLTTGASLPGLTKQLGEISQRHELRHVVALSFGTIIATQLALDFPEQFKTFVLGAPALGGGLRDPSVEVCYEELRMMYKYKGFGPHLCQRWMQSPPGIFPSQVKKPSVWKELWDIVNDHDWWELRDDAFYSLCSYLQSEKRLRAISASIAVVVGEEEMPAFKRTGEIIRRSVSHCQRINLPNTGHLCLLEDPDCAASIIKRHIVGQHSSLPTHKDSHERRY